MDDPSGPLLGYLVALEAVIFLSVILVVDLVRKALEALRSRRARRSDDRKES